MQVVHDDQPADLDLVVMWRGRVPTGTVQARTSVTRYGNQVRSRTNVSQETEKELQLAVFVRDLEPYQFTAGACAGECVDWTLTWGNLAQKTVDQLEEFVTRNAKTIRGKK